MHPACLKVRQRDMNREMGKLIATKRIDTIWIENGFDGLNCALRWAQCWFAPSNCSRSYLGNSCLANRYGSIPTQPVHNFSQLPMMLPLLYIWHFQPLLPVRRGNISSCLEPLGLAEDLGPFCGLLFLQGGTKELASYSRVTCRGLFLSFSIMARYVVWAVAQLFYFILGLIFHHYIKGFIVVWTWTRLLDSYRPWNILALDYYLWVLKSLLFRLYGIYEPKPLLPVFWYVHMDYSFLTY